MRPGRISSRFFHLCKQPLFTRDFDNTHRPWTLVRGVEEKRHLLISPGSSNHVFQKSKTNYMHTYLARTPRSKYQSIPEIQGPQSKTPTLEPSSKKPMKIPFPSPRPLSFPTPSPTSHSPPLSPPSGTAPPPTPASPPPQPASSRPTPPPYPLHTLPPARVAETQPTRLHAA